MTVSIPPMSKRPTCMKKNPSRIDPEPLQHGGRVRPLKGKKGAVVLNRHRGVAGKVGLEVGNVMRGPPGIDDKVQVALEARHHQIVENAAIGVKEHGIAHPAFGRFRRHRSVSAPRACCPCRRLSAEPAPCARRRKGRPRHESQGALS